ncbi:hypothetical protein LU293_03725 [Moraxella nasovis]|uniref:hypothetical protein n=1 Tax=Moraxella nasovis TaxID=2904121 RepID=UPI001F61BF0A|nr:hypothetical protein [Moraxella nasovis]UNU74011.1 hypothetical protein LU293_03725 [Moraxella nasovis]
MKAIGTKLSLAFGGLLLVNASAIANDQTKVDTIKKIYQRAIDCNDSSICGDNPIWSYLDDSLRSAVKHAYENKDLGDISGDPFHPCTDWGFGDNALLGWSQDSPLGGFKMNQFQFSILKNGDVRAKFKDIVNKRQNFPSFFVDIKLSEFGNTYKISDIISHGDSFKDHLNQCHLY